jgi:hypothetical protein
MWNSPAPTRSDFAGLPRAAGGRSCLPHRQLDAEATSPTIICRIRSLDLDRLRLSGFGKHALEDTKRWVAANRDVVERGAYMYYELT